jgi:benzodiazapine receptor
MADEDGPALTSGRDIAGLFVCLGLVFAVSAIGGAITVPSIGGWYQSLEKPGYTPPDWIFGPVWSALYIMMAVAAWRVWRRGRRPLRSWSLAAYAAQLALNLVWPILFFDLHHIGLAAIESAVLLAMIVVTTFTFWRMEVLAGVLLVPYALWVAFATVLNAAIWTLN